MNLYPWAWAALAAFVGFAFGYMLGLTKNASIQTAAATWTQDAFNRAVERAIEKALAREKESTRTDRR